MHVVGYAFIAFQKTVKACSSYFNQYVSSLPDDSSRGRNMWELHTKCRCVQWPLYFVDFIVS